MEPSKINSVSMVRLIRDQQHELTQNMTDEEKVRFYQQQAKALLMRLEKRVRERQAKMVVAS